MIGQQVLIQIETSAKQQTCSFDISQEERYWRAEYDSFEQPKEMERMNSASDREEYEYCRELNPDTIRVRG
jgi:hypothetical protein